MRRMYDQEEIKDIAVESGKKLYLHKIKIETNNIYKIPSLTYQLYNTSNSKLNTKEALMNAIYGHFNIMLDGNSTTIPDEGPTKFIGESLILAPPGCTVKYFSTYPSSNYSTYTFSWSNLKITDTVIEM